MGPLAILAFDHRSSFLRSLLGVEGEPTDADLARAREAKTLIAEGLASAVRDGRVPVGEAGALVDERFGADALAIARAAGVRVAVPVEASGRRELAFEHDDWRARLDGLAPDWAKVLVRYHPDDDEAKNARQRGLLRELRAHCDATARPLMIELLVPPLPGQAGPGYETEVRPGLMERTIDLFIEVGITAELWKIEGLDRREDCARIARSAVTPCVVLGRGADRTAVGRWLRAAAGVPGFVGFAIGRSIWWDALRDLPWEDRDRVTGAIADSYATYAALWHEAVAAAAR